MIKTAGDASIVKAAASAAAVAETPRALAKALAPLDLDHLSAQDYSLLARALARRAGAPDVKMAYLGNFTLDLLPRYVEVAAAREGLVAGTYLGRFDQHVQEVLDERSALVDEVPDVVFLALSLRLLRPGRIGAFATLDAADRRALKEEVLAHVESWVESAERRLPATLLVANFPSPAWPLAGVADVKAEYGETELYAELNLELLRRLKAHPRAQLFDLERLTARFGKDRVLDRKMYYLAKMEWSAAFLPCVAGEVVRHVKAVKGLAKKCVVLDLDNTLWGGVVGEEGPAGVKCGAGDPEAEAFLDFQRCLKGLQARGVLLAVSSKNNPADVHEVFAARPEMPLKLEDFAALEIGWGHKHEALQRIAADLNVGVDSLVFVDDNPAEISLIRQMLPEVEVVQLPPDPADFAAALLRMNGFEKTAVLEEDARKTALYHENRQRQELERAAGGDLATYLASLGTEVSIGRATPADLPRVHQLFTKTNQFNLTTVRYSPGDVERFADSPWHELGVVKARDRFGDLGTIGTYLLRKEGRTVHVDSLLMSCRAMGRGIETAMMNHVKRRLLDDRGRLELRGRYVPTAKNQPAERFFEQQGFLLLERQGAGEKTYWLPRAKAEPFPCDWIRLVQDEAVLGRG